MEQQLPPPPPPPPVPPIPEVPYNILKLGDDRYAYRENLNNNNNNNNSMEELGKAMRLRGLKKFSDLTELKQFGEKLGEIRLIRTYEEQKALVIACRELEEKLLDGGADLVQQANFPSQDLEELYRLVKREEDLSGVLQWARKVFKTCDVPNFLAAAEALRSKIGIADDLLKSNLKQFNLRFKVEELEAERNNLLFSLISHLLKESFKRLEEDNSSLKKQSKFGLQYSSTKVYSTLTECVRLSSFVASDAFAVKERSDFAHSLSRAKELLRGGKPSFGLRSSGGSVGATTKSWLKEEDLSALSKHELAVALRTKDEFGNLYLFEYCSLRECDFESLGLELEECVNKQRQTLLHVCSLENAVRFVSWMNTLQSAVRMEFLCVTDRERDTSLLSLIKRVNAKNRETLLPVVYKMIEFCPQSLEIADKSGRFPLQILATKLGNFAKKLVEFEAEKKLVEFSGNASSVVFDRYFLSPTLSDLTLVLDSGEKIFAHRIILTSQSNVLRTLLEDPKFVEFKQNKIQLPEVEFEQLRIVLQFMYCGTLTLKDVVWCIKALYLADHWLLFSFGNEMCERLKKFISLENCFLFVESLDIIKNGCFSQSVKMLRKEAAAFALCHYHNGLYGVDTTQEHLKGAADLLMQP